MAYARRRSGSYKARRPTKSSGRRSRSTVKMRPYRRTRRTYRPKLTRKRILNITSRKKRDTLLTASNTSTTGSTSPTNLGDFYVSATNGAQTLWAPTARTFIQAAGGAATTVQEAMRTASVCYMRGVKENIRIQTSSGLPWLWRRVCFRFRISQSAFSTVVSGDTPTQAYSPFIETTSNGYERLWFNQAVNAMGNTTYAQNDILFKGRQGVDWYDIMTAPVDTRRVDLSYDKTRRIASGNASGVHREYKLWHPMNKNIVYNDDETGENEEGSPYSVRDKQGMGDYIIMDYFSCGIGGTSSDLLNIRSTSSLYWHEK